MKSIEWYSGINNYRKHSHLINEETKQHVFTTALLDVTVDEGRHIHAVFSDLLSVRQTTTVEVLYSGGLDSECVLISCMKNKIPVVAITMRMLVKGYPINTHDLYYSEKFCRENNIQHRLVDLHVDKFFAGGDHIQYLAPYYITEPHVATHFWLFEQCSGFPVMGGEYSWPQVNKKLSPHRHQYMYYDKFLADRNIAGIGNMLSHSQECNLSFIKSNIYVRDSAPGYFGNFASIPLFKQKIMENVGFGTMELRMKNYGWESSTVALTNKTAKSLELMELFGRTTSQISWEKQIADVLGGEPGINDKYH